MQTARKVHKKLKIDHFNESKYLFFFNQFVVLVDKKTREYAVTSKVIAKNGLGFYEDSVDAVSNATRKIENQFKESRKQSYKNKQLSVRDQVPLGSRWEDVRSKSGASERTKVVLEPIKQSIGVKAVNWKTKSNIRHDYSY